MRRLLIILVLLMGFKALSSQEMKPTKALTKQDYQIKSDGQKTAAWILLTVGVGLIAIAAPGNVDLDVFPAIAIGAGVAIIASTTLFIASGRNKRKAASMTANFQIQQRPPTAFMVRSHTPIPSLSVRLNF